MFDGMVKAKIHKPVMCNEILEYLKLAPGMTVVDATIGCAGHSIKILERILPGGRLIGIDRDGESLEIARTRLSTFGEAVNLIHGNFRDLDKISVLAGIDKVDAIIFDLGLSSVQLSNPERGFSFQSDGPLDMRMDRTSFIQAYDLINNLNEEEISSLLWSFGQERFHNRIAHLLVAEREKAPINSTSQVTYIVMKAMPHHYRFGRIHPATRTFQAMRIAVNRELEALDEGIKKAIDLVKPNGRIAVISFHSLEDRIIKLNFRSARSEEKLKIITPKPLRASQEERTENPSCRSARLRVSEKQ
jgi:16S rRNA (cytosine1402-N4)-methyltransferase